MRATIRTLTVAALLACAGEALAHGGSYYPPPPPRNPAVPRGPTPPGRATTPSGGGAPAVTPGTEVTPPDPDDWTRWWFANRRLLLPGAAAEPGERDGTTAEGEAWRERARVALRKALGDSDVDVASAAAVALGKAHDDASRSALTAALSDRERDGSVREAAALGLALLGSAGGSGTALDGEALLDVARDRKADERLRGICDYALAVRRDGAAGDALRRAADASPRDEPSVAGAGPSGLGITGDGLTRPDLEALLAKRGDQHRIGRVYAAHGLARLGGAASLPPLRTAAGNKDAHTRRAAALALGVIARGDDASAVVLAAMLRDDPDASCRGAAAIGLGRIGSGGARDALVAALADKKESLRPYAALGLGLLAVTSGEAEVVRPLVAILREKGDDSLRGAAACALGMARAPYAAPELLAVVQQRGDPQLRAHAAFALGRLGGGVEDRQALRELLIEREHDWLPREAALALGELRDRASVRVLRRLVEEGPTLHVQAAGALALGSIGGDPAGTALTDLLEKGSQPPLARAMAAVALGQMLDLRRGATLAVIGADLDWQLFTPAVQEVLTIL